MPSSFGNAAELAGFFLAHAVWCVSDKAGGPLVPFVGMSTKDGKQTLTRFVSEEMEEGVAQARKAVEASADKALAAVVVYDGYITLADGVKRDALLAELTEYGAPNRTLQIALPYRSPKAKEGFAVFKPKFVGASGLDQAELQAAGADLFRGVDAHEEGVKVWNAHLDQSL